MSRRQIHKSSGHMGGESNFANDSHESSNDETEEETIPPFTHVSRTTLLFRGAGKVDQFVQASRNCSEDESIIREIQHQDEGGPPALWAPLPGSIVPLLPILQTQKQSIPNSGNETLTLPPIRKSVNESNYPFGFWDWRNKGNLEDPDFSGNYAKRTLYDKRYNSLEVIVLENKECKVSICPKFGGRILSFFDKLKQLEMLHHDPQEGFKPIRSDSCCSGWLLGGICVSMHKRPNPQNLFPVASLSGSDDDTSWVRVGDVDVQTGDTWMSEYFLSRHGGMRLLQRVTIFPAKIGKEVRFSVVACVPWDVSKQEKVFSSTSCPPAVQTNNNVMGDLVSLEVLSKQHAPHRSEHLPEELKETTGERKKNGWAIARKEIKRKAPKIPSPETFMCIGTSSQKVPKQNSHKNQEQEEEESNIEFSSHGICVVCRDGAGPETLKFVPIHHPGKDSKIGHISATFAFKPDVYVRHKSFELFWMPTDIPEKECNDLASIWSSKFTPSTRPEKTATFIRASSFAYCPYRKEWTAFFSGIKETLPSTPPPPCMIEQLEERFRKEEKLDETTAMYLSAGLFHLGCDARRCWSPILRTVEKTILLKTTETGVPAIEFLTRAKLPSSLWRIAAILYWKMHGLLEESLQCFDNAVRTCSVVDTVLILERDHLLDTMCMSSARSANLELIDEDYKWIKLERNVSIHLLSGNINRAVGGLLGESWPSEFQRSVRSSLLETAYNVSRNFNKNPCFLPSLPKKPRQRPWRSLETCNTEPVLENTTPLF